MSERSLYEPHESDESLKVKDDIGFKGNVNSLVRLCFLAAGDEYLFRERVEMLYAILPVAIGDDEEFKRRVDAECTVTPPPRYIFHDCCGIPIKGTVEEPFVDEETGEVINPTKVQDPPYTDYQKLFKVCMRALEGMGATWQKDTKAGGA
jgi:hypothetical protein